MPGLQNMTRVTRVSFQERRRRKWRIVENAVPKYCIQIEVTLFLRNKQESTTSTEAYKYWKCIDFIGSAIGDRFLTWGSLARWPMIWQEKRNVKEPIYNLGFPLGRVRGGVVLQTHQWLHKVTYHHVLQLLLLWSHVARSWRIINADLIKLIHFQY